MINNADKSKKRRLNYDDDDGTYGGKSRSSKQRVTKTRKSTKRRKSGTKRLRRRSRTSRK